MVCESLTGYRSITELPLVGVTADSTKGTSAPSLSGVTLLLHDHPFHFNPLSFFRVSRKEGLGFPSRVALGTSGTFRCAIRGIHDDYRVDVFLNIKFPAANTPFTRFSLLLFHVNR